MGGARLTCRICEQACLNIVLNFDIDLQIDVIAKKEALWSNCRAVSKDNEARTRNEQNLVDGVQS
jgi:hypothetical protein